MPRPKTRSKTNAPSTRNSTWTDFEEHPKEPLKLLILPKGGSSNARICTLPHPRTSQSCRYYFCPQKGLYELTRIAAPKAACQSWLIGRQPRGKHGVAGTTKDAADDTTSIANLQETAMNNAALDDNENRRVGDGYAIQSPEMLITTPMDLLFLVLTSLFASSCTKSPSSKGVFLSTEDIFDRICDGSPHFHTIIKHVGIKQLIEGRMRVVCDTVQAGDEEMFRLNLDRLLSEILAKAKNLIALGLPTSIEEKFVHKALQEPVMAVKRKESAVSEPNEAFPEDATTIKPDFVESAELQASTSTSASVKSEASSSTNVTIPDDPHPGNASKEVQELLRLRVALTYILSTYVPNAIATTLNAKLASELSPVNFSLLDEELSRIDKMRREALASRSFSDFSRKRDMQDEEAAVSRAEKKARKEEEEKKKKASETKGIRDLKKVDTSGMKKMSDFFSKKPDATKNR